MRGGPNLNKNRQYGSKKLIQSNLIGNDYAFLVMNYHAGGTLAELISSKDPLREPFSERRIAWYLLQLCDALAFAHERGVAHHDVKSDNILIDSHGGGTLVLTDFGTAVQPGLDVLGFTESYASPELLAVFRSSWSNMGTSMAYDLAAQAYKMIDPTGVDAFGIGCIGFELLACQKLVDIPALVDKELRLADCTLEEMGNILQSFIHCQSYSETSFEIVRRLLEAAPQTRARPNDFPKALREDDRSPLLAPELEAFFLPKENENLTMDNIRLGTFVQRGPDWSDGEEDGGCGSVGVVVQLDPDPLYTYVLWKPGEEPSVHRIGKECKMELVIGRCPFGMQIGVLELDDSNHIIGQIFKREQHPSDGMIVAKIAGSRIFLLSPSKNNSFFPQQNKSRDPPPAPQSSFRSQTLVPETIPENWKLSPGVKVQASLEEEQFVKVKFFASMPWESYTITKIERIQNHNLWKAYSIRKQLITGKNWGIPNEVCLFHGTSKTPPAKIIQDDVGFDPRFCDEGRYGRGSYFAVNALYSHQFSHTCSKTDGAKVYQMFLASVALGRVDDRRSQSRGETSNLRRPDPGCHSVRGQSSLNTGVNSDISVLYDTTTQAYPMFLITYTKNRPLGFQSVPSPQPLSIPSFGRLSVPVAPAPSPPFFDFPFQIQQR